TLATTLVTTNHNRGDAMSNMTFATTIKSRTDCENFLQDRKERKLTYETYVKRAWNNQRDYVVTHHGSDIARFNHVGDQLWAASYQVMRDGHPLATEVVHTTFDNCGWSSPTTVRSEEHTSELQSR